MSRLQLCQYAFNAASAESLTGIGELPTQRGSTLKLSRAGSVGAHQWLSLAGFAVRANERAYHRCPKRPEPAPAGVTLRAAVAGRLYADFPFEPPPARRSHLLLTGSVRGTDGRLQARQPTRISGADAFANTLMLAQQAARQSRTSAAHSDVHALEVAATHRKLMGLRPEGGPRLWVAGVAPTTKGAPTRSLMMRLPTEGGAAELSVPPARPAPHVELAARPRAEPPARRRQAGPRMRPFFCSPQARLVRRGRARGLGRCRAQGGGRASQIWRGAAGATAAQRGAEAAPAWRLAAAHVTEAIGRW